MNMIKLCFTNDSLLYQYFIVFRTKKTSIVLILIHFRVEMDVNSDPVEIIENMDEEVYSGGKISFLDQEVKTEIIDIELEVKIEKTDETEHVKTEIVEETYNSEPPKTIGEKGRNQGESNLEIENKKIKEEFVVFEELDVQQEPQDIEEINRDDLNNEVL